MLKTVPNCVFGSKQSSTGTLPPHISAARISHIQRRALDGRIPFRRTVRPGGYASGADFACSLLREGTRPGAPGAGR
jgi:hypothetical protein